MNCRQAREIINLVFDGEGHPYEADARGHVHDCAECRQWLAGMERVMGLMASAQEKTPPINFAAGVMARLPDRHPASVERRQVWISRRALAWMGAGWAVGFVVLSVLAALAVRWFGTPAGAESIVSAYTALRVSLGSLGVFAVAAKPLAVMFREVSHAVRPNWAVMAMGAFAINCGVLGLVYLVWRRRLGVANTMSVLV